MSMTEFADKTMIAVLEEYNSKLITENSNLKAEVNDLKHEIARLSGENPDYIKHIREKVTEYERRETEFKERIAAISEETASYEKKHQAVKQLLAALKVEGTDLVEGAIDQYYKKKQTMNILIAFVLGVLASLSAWGITSYVEKL